jgi:hypothetical protein
MLSPLGEALIEISTLPEWVTIVLLSELGQKQSHLSESEMVRVVLLR